MAETRALELSVGVADGDPEELEELTRQLRGQLEELDVEAVEPISGGPVPGTKAAEGIVIGLLVRYGPAALSAVVRTVAGWVSRDKRRSLTLKVDGRELTLDAATAEQQDRLVEAFLAGGDG